jgi:hypothetical protein
VKFPSSVSHIKEGVVDALALDECALPAEDECVHERCKAETCFQV